MIEANKVYKGKSVVTDKTMIFCIKKITNYYAKFKFLIDDGRTFNYASWECTLEGMNNCISDYVYDIEECPEFMEMFK